MPRSVKLAPVDAKPGQPLYHSVKDAVRAAIDSGVFPAGHRLPSTKALSEQLSVSLVTVHRALQELCASGVLRRGQGRGTFVHEEYRDRVETSTGMRFGLVFHRESSLADFYHGQILEGVRQGADEFGVDLVLLRFGEDWRNECQGFLYVNPFRVQLARPPRFGAKRGPKQSAPAGPPVMVVGASFDVDGVSNVDTDNRDIARQAVLHLTAIGHERVGFVGGTGEVSNDRDRREGFEAALAERGLRGSDHWNIASPGWRLDDASRETLIQRLRSDDRPSAIFAAGYYFALDVFSAAHDAGLRIPADLSVVGVDDPPSAMHLHPPLTTLRQPLTQLGKLAARHLFDQIGEDRPTVQRTTLRAELVERRSTAPPTHRL